MAQLCIAGDLPDSNNGASMTDRGRSAGTKCYVENTQPVLVGVDLNCSHHAKNKKPQPEVEAFRLGPFAVDEVAGWPPHVVPFGLNVQRKSTSDLVISSASTGAERQRVPACAGQSARSAGGSSGGGPTQTRRTFRLAAVKRCCHKCGNTRC